jgi:hypothetical protein
VESPSDAFVPKILDWWWQSSVFSLQIDTGCIAIGTQALSPLVLSHVPHGILFPSTHPTLRQVIGILGTLPVPGSKMDG